MAEAKLPDLLKSPPGEGTQENVLHFRYPDNREEAYATSIHPNFIHYLSVSGHFNLMHCFHRISSVFILFHMNTTDASNNARNCSGLRLFSFNLRLFSFVSTPISTKNRAIPLNFRPLHAFARHFHSRCCDFQALHGIASDSTRTLCA